MFKLYFFAFVFFVLAAEASFYLEKNSNKHIITRNGQLKA